MARDKLKTIARTSLSLSFSLYGHPPVRCVLPWFPFRYLSLSLSDVAKFRVQKKRNKTKHKKKIPSFRLLSVRCCVCRCNWFIFARRETGASQRRGMSGDAARVFSATTAAAHIHHHRLSTDGAQFFLCSPFMNPALFYTVTNSGHRFSPLPGSFSPFLPSLSPRACPYVSW